MTQDKRRRLNEERRSLSTRRRISIVRSVGSTAGTGYRDQGAWSLLQKEQEIENEAKGSLGHPGTNWSSSNAFQHGPRRKPRLRSIRKVEDEARLEAMQTLKRLDEETRAKSRQLAAEVISGSDSTLGCRARRRVDGLRRRSSERGYEGPDHRPRGPEHQGPGRSHGRGHHRR